MATKEIIQKVAEKKITKYVQVAELTAFLSAGFCMGRSLLMPGFVMFIIGIFLALIAGEAAIAETKLEYGLK